MDRKRPAYHACWRRTFLVKVKAHRGEPLNERADTQAENARQLPPECRQWTTRTQRMTYEWRDNDGVKHVTTWTKAVRNAIVRGGAEFHRQKALNHAGNNWKGFMGSTDTGLHRENHEQGSDRCSPHRNTSAHSKCRV